LTWGIALVQEMMSFYCLIATEGTVQLDHSKHSTLKSFGWQKKAGLHKHLYTTHLPTESLQGTPNFASNSTLLYSKPSSWFLQKT